LTAERLLEHRRIWQDKPVLAAVYRPWFEDLLGSLGAPRRVLELGAGPGFLSEYARPRFPLGAWVSLDILEAPWNDVVGDGLRLPFRDGAFDALAALDFLHHLLQPARFFAEAARVLAPGGRLAVVEPWVTPLSFPVYRWLHQEGCRPRLDPWQPFGDVEGKDAFQGDAAVVWRLVRCTTPERWQELGFDPPQATPQNAFAYLPSLGFRPRSLLPRWLVKPLQALDSGLGRLAPVTGLRARVVWRKR
jgi:SAM-dependent methyltransferase